jgi:hypothetical protein
MQNLWDDIIDMFKTPFVGDLDLTHLFLLVGLVLFFVAVWVMILNHVRLAAMEAV